MGSVQAREDVEYLRAIVPVMRELGVVVAFDVQLGPEPTRAAILERKVAQVEPGSPEAVALAKEQAALERQARIDAERERIGNLIGHPPTAAEYERYRGVDGDGYPL